MFTGDRKVAFGDNLGDTIFVAVGHDDDDAFSTGYEGPLHPPFP